MMNHAAADDGYAVTAELYDLVVPYRDRPDVQFFVDAAIESGSPVLELGCGTGRVLIPTARAGIDIVGLDLSEGMLAVCAERLRGESVDVQSRVNLARGDMRDFSLRRSFGLVTLPFRPFQHLVTVDEQRSCLRNIREHLTDDGRLILDLFNPDLAALANRKPGDEFGEEPPFSTPDGRRVVRHARLVADHRANQVIDVELIYDVTHADERHERLVHGFKMRYLFRFEAEHLLARCGFEVEHLYSGYDRSPFGSRYPGELIFVARKAA
jgi:SAM-dependent methyltransferase